MYFRSLKWKFLKSVLLVSHKHSYSNLGFQNPGQIANIPPYNLSLIFMWMTHTKKFFVTFPSHLLTPIYRPFFNSHCSTEVLAIRILRYFSYHRYLKSDNLQYNTLHRGAFCQFPFRWIYYYGSNKSTGKETGKMHLCELCSLSHDFLLPWVCTGLKIVSVVTKVDLMIICKSDLNTLQRMWKSRVTILGLLLSNFISNLVTDYIPKRRGEPSLFSFE